jgi:acetyl-CoA carboxylase biotin carboxyl carrier protein
LYGGIKMNLRDIKELVKIIDSSSLTEFQFEKDNVKILLKKEIILEQVTHQEILPLYNEGRAREIIEYSGKVKNEEEIIDTVDNKVDENVHIVKSPILGTFYASPNPDAPAYVKVGDKVKNGDVLCIIEAMKLMNEINSDAEGEIVEVLVENQSPVEYGQPLFKIRKA